MLTDRNVLQGWQSDRLNLLFLLSLGLLVLGAGLGLRDPWPADEPRFALVAKQMVESGQWLFPFRGGEIYCFSVAVVAGPAWMYCADL